MAGTRPAMTKREWRSCLADAEGQHLAGALGGFERVAGLVQQVRDVDAGERIGAFDDQDLARLHGLERLAGAQRRERAFEAAQVEGVFRHVRPSSRSIVIRPRLASIYFIYCARWAAG